MRVFQKVKRTAKMYLIMKSVQFSSVQFLSHVWLFATHGLQHTRPPCPSPTPGVYPNSCLLGQWCHPTISSSVVPFSSHLQSFPASGSFQMSQLFTSGGQSIAVQFSPSVASDSLQPHESQHARPLCPSPTPRVHSNSCPSSQWCHRVGDAIESVMPSSHLILCHPLSSCLQSLPTSGSFPMSQLFAWGGQSIGVSASASVLPMNTQDWSP